MSRSAPVLVVGAGLAGLACALRLREAGRDVTILEASDAPGGRVRTDTVDGFQLDRGFQVLLSAYPECRRLLDYPALQFGAFRPGALVRRHGRFHRVGDPLRAPADALATLTAPVGSLGDKLRVLALRQRARSGSLAELFARPETTTLRALQSMGFSPTMIDSFFRPFLGGIFLGRDLGASSRMLEFVFRMLSEGDTVLPAGGMQRIAEQLAARLPPGALRLGAEVVEARGQGVRLADGAWLPAAAVVLATEADTSARLLGTPVPPAPRSVTTLYYAAATSPVGAPLLVLNGEETGLVNSLCVPSDVAAGYAPPGQALVSVTVLGLPEAADPALEAQVRRELGDWYGAAAVDRWRHLRTVRVRWAQPDQAPGALAAGGASPARGGGLFEAGDHLEGASIHGALRSGRRAAEAVLAA